MVDALASQLSPLPADHVPSSDRQTFPQLYKFCAENGNKGEGDAIRLQCCQAGIHGSLVVIRRIGQHGWGSAHVAEMSSRVERMNGEVRAISQAAKVQCSVNVSVNTVSRCHG